MLLEDNAFSYSAKSYVHYRPSYPKELFEYLASLTDCHQQAWDCATGNGQAAIALADHYDRVIATDISAKQLEEAIEHERVLYYQASCESSSLEAGSVDLITVAQAAHWFNLPVFEEECRRVLKPGGAVGLWMYSLFRISPEIDAIIDHLYWKILDGYWPVGRAIVERHYSEVNLALPQIKSPPTFELQQHWDYDHVIGYLSTWSSVHNYIKQNDQDPINLVKQDLAKAWVDIDQARDVYWPITLKVYKHPATKENY